MQAMLGCPTRRRSRSIQSAWLRRGRERTLAAPGDPTPTPCRVARPSTCGAWTSTIWRPVYAPPTTTTAADGIQAARMSALAARKARLAAQGGSASSSSSDLVAPASPQTATTSRRQDRARRGDRARRQKRDEFGAGSERDGFGAVQQAAAKRARMADEASSSESDTGNSSDEGSEGEGEGEEGGTGEAGEAGGIAKGAWEPSPVCSSYVPIKEGRRKNWHFDARRGPNDATLTLGLSPIQTILFVGKARLRVLEGRCSFAGATLTPNHRSVVVFAPQNAPLPILQASPGPPTCTFLGEAQWGERCHSVVVEVQSLPLSGIDEISTACPLVRSGAFSAPSSAPGSSPPLDGFHPLLVTAKGLVANHIPPSWERALSLIAGVKVPTRCLIKGPKRVGKSTFSRHLVNRLVSTRSSQVAYLETDLGQTEYGPPGMVALHVFGSLRCDSHAQADLVVGPSWTLLRYPLRSHFLGDVTPREDPAAYLAAIEDLVRFYCSDLQSIGVPLVVNTQGWVKGLGANLLADIQGMVSPTHLVDMMQGDVGTPALAKEASVGPTVVAIEAAPLSLTRDRGLNAVEARTLNLVSYFYSTQLPGAAKAVDCAFPQWDFSVPLVQRRPYIVNVREGLRGGLFVLAKGAAVEEHLQLMALNGSCVAIVCARQQSSDADEASENGGGPRRSSWVHSLTRRAPPLRESLCVAMAIVRSIDVDAGAIHLLSPLSPQHLASCLAPDARLSLVKGAIEIPIWLSLNYQLIEASQSSEPTSGQPVQLEGVPLAEVPYLDFEAEADNVVGLARRRVRRNILRRNQR